MKDTEQQVRTKYLHDYLKLGFSLIPVKGKVARFHWKEYRFNPQDFTEPDTNIGLRTGLLPTGDYLYVVDLDSKELLGFFYGSHPTLMSAPLVSTGKGWHIYVTWKEQPRTRHLRGIDIIANGYVLCPPSIHPNGHVYKFIIPLRGLPLSYNPEWLAIKEVHSTQSSITPTCLTENIQSENTVGERILSGVPEGQRHNTLVCYLGILFARHYTEEEALARAVAWNLKNRPPMTQSELLSTVKSCWATWDLFEG